jgi:hypothetical protein
MASKITIKRSTTSVPPTGLSFGEMAFVQGTGLTANQLYVGISGGSPVWVGAQIGTTGSWTDNAAKTSLATQYAIDQRISTQISASNVITTADDNTNATRYLVLTSATGAGVTLGVDASTGPLSYNPATMEMTLGGDLKIAGDIVAAASKQTGEIFSSITSKLNIGLAATGITMGGTTGSIALRNPKLILGTTASTITTSGGTANNLTISPYGNLILQPTWEGAAAAGTRPSITISNSTTPGSQNVTISGGDLYLATKEQDAIASASNIIFEGGIAGGSNKTTLTVAEPTAARTLYLPDASDTLVGKATIDTFTNKTYDTAGSGNVFRIAGVTLSAVTGTGSVVLATSPTLTTPNLGTPSTLVGTNITGTATGLTAGRVVTNANLTGAITSVGNTASLGSFSSADLFGALSTDTGTGLVVFGTSPTLTTSIVAGSTTFALINDTATTVNFAGAATALNIGVLGGTAAFAGALTVAGNLTVNGTTTTINSTTLTVDDKNIEMAAIDTPDDATANGGGIIIKGTTDKSILWDSTNSNLTSNQDWNLPTGKVFKINNASVLSSSALGSGITGSSLTQVGTITSGTWSGSFGAVSGANLTVLTAGGLTGTIPSGVLGNSNVFIGTTSVALNRTSASISLTGVNIDGSAGSATTAGTATNATNIAVASETSDTTCFVTFVTDNTGNLPAKINSTLTYNAVSGELSATLIDGGSF